MSMLTRQADKLRETAGEVKRIKDNGVGWLWCDAITLDDAVKEMREAADTIENLRNRLTETCELEINTDPRTIKRYGAAERYGVAELCKCSACGAKVLAIPAHYCPNCGRKVV